MAKKVRRVLLGEVPKNRIVNRIRKLQKVRQKLVDESTILDIDKKKLKFADVEGRIDELGRLLHGRGIKVVI